MISKNLVVLWFFVLVFGSGARSSVGANGPDEMDVYRLPNNTIPVSYDLNIMPNYNYFTDDVELDGEVEIVIDVIFETLTITLNCKNILVYVVYVHEKITDYDVDVSEIIYDTRNEQCKILLKSRLKVGVQYLINIEFNLKIDKNDMEGFYKSTYNDKYNHKQ